MQSLKELYKIGNGPSSSHTMGPKRAVEIFKNKNIDATSFKIILYGSLALTGKGHLTDYIIKETLAGYKTEIIFDTETECKVHPNTFDIFAMNGNEIMSTWRVYSVGGGTFQIEGKKVVTFDEIYKEKDFTEIKEYCIKNNCDLFDYVVKNEGEERKEFLNEIWSSMQNTIQTGLEKEGNIPGKLNISRIAKRIFENIKPNETETLKRNKLLRITKKKIVMSLFMDDNACAFRIFKRIFLEFASLLNINWHLII